MRAQVQVHHEHHEIHRLEPRSHMFGRSRETSEAGCDSTEWKVTAVQQSELRCLHSVTSVDGYLRDGQVPHSLPRTHACAHKVSSYTRRHHTVWSWLPFHFWIHANQQLNSEVPYRFLRKCIMDCKMFVMSFKTNIGAQRNQVSAAINLEFIHSLCC